MRHREIYEGKQHDRAVETGNVQNNLLWRCESDEIYGESQRVLNLWNSKPASLLCKNRDVLSKFSVNNKVMADSDAD